MPLSDREQAILTFVSMVFFAAGTAAAAVPAWIPEPARWYIAVTLWIFGILGLSIMQALGIEPPQVVPPA